jgi:hypothetical protein
MKAKLFLAAASTLILSACAATQTSTSGASGATATAASGSTMYCWKRSLEQTGDTLLCNWEASSRDACKSINQVRLARATVNGAPRDAGRCDNGEWLVAVNTK